MSYGLVRLGYVTRMNPYRFEILATWSKAVPQLASTTECSVWATDDERLLGVVSDNHRCSSICGVNISLNIS